MNILHGVLTALLVAQAADEEKALNQAWLNKDVRLAETAIQTLPGTLDDGPYRTFLKHFKYKERRDLGFGFMLLSAKKPGGYTSLTADALELNGRPVKLRIGQTARNKAVREALTEIWKDLYDPVHGGLFYELSDAEAIQQGIESIRSGLNITVAPGPIDPADRPMALLMDPMVSLVYGTICYYSASPPDSREAMEVIYTRRAPELFYAMLESPNPEARIYAMEGLIRLKAEGISISDSVESAIGKVAGLPIEIRTCEGCIILYKNGFAIRNALLQH